VSSRILMKPTGLPLQEPEQTCEACVCNDKARASEHVGEMPLEIETFIREHSGGT